MAKSFMNLYSSDFFKFKIFQALWTCIKNKEIFNFELDNKTRYNLLHTIKYIFECFMIYFIWHRTSSTRIKKFFSFTSTKNYVTTLTKQKYCGIWATLIQIIQSTMHIICSLRIKNLKKRRIYNIIRKSDYNS